jgi:cell division protein FtsN
MLTYFGEISRAQRANTAFTSNLAFDVRASFPLKNSFYISFRALYGKVSANERTVDKNRNFQSQITNFGLDFSYNFNHFLSEKRVLDPFLSVGFDAFVFNSKTDLYDANGNLYYYWSDGSIKDRAETPENLNTAQELNRDYDYETDYRRSNVSGAGYYEKYSFAIPVGAGVNMRLSHRMHAKLGATYSFLFTDLMDGVSSKGKGVYEGDAANDGLLYTYVGLSFDLSKRSGSIDDDDVDGISNEELAAMTTGDSDFDGVADLNDECPETPGGVEVDEVGCPLDEDKDGVPDYRDQELGTDSNAVVDSNGIALTDEQLERIYLRFMDSTGVLSYYEDTIYTNDLPTQTFRKKDKQFSVQIDNDSLTSEQASQLLSEGKVKTVKDGDKDALLVGEFKTIEEALAKDKELKSKGIGTRAIVVETPTGKVVNANIVGVFVGDQSGKQLEKSQPGTVFRIQVGAFRGEPDPKYFKGMNVIGVKNDDGLTRYYTGNYSSYDKAAKARVQLKGAGYGDCVIKAFAEGGQVSLKDAGATFIAPEPGTETGNTNTGNAGPKRDKSKVKFKVQLGSYQNSIPMEDFNKYVKLGEIKSEKGLDGYTRYFVGTFSTYEEAEAFKKELEQKGIPEAFVAGEYDGKTISAQDAIDILEE